MNISAAILLYNTHLFGDTLPIMSEKHTHEDKFRAFAIADAVEATDADVVLLTEVWDKNLAKIILAQTADHYPNSYLPEQRNIFGFGSGLLILSKFAIIDPSTTKYSWLIGSDIFSQKGFIVANLDLPGGPLGLFLTHVQSHNGLLEYVQARASNLKQLAEAVAAYKQVHPARPVLVAGDLNVVAEEPGQPTKEYKAMTELFGGRKLIDLARQFYPNSQAWPGFTYDSLHNTLIPQFNPEIAEDHGQERIDYFFGTPDIKPIAITTDPANNQSVFKSDYRYNSGTDNLSDHFPLLLEVIVKPEASPAGR